MVGYFSHPSPRDVRSSQLNIQHLKSTLRIATVRIKHCNKHIVVTLEGAKGIPEQSRRCVFIVTPPQLMEFSCFQVRSRSIKLTIKHLKSI
jgi:hypothetical protein